MSDDSWNCTGRTYIADFREKLDVVARTLGARNQFNHNLGCAELHDNWGVRARVSVQGEAGVPEIAKVVSQHPLQLVSKALFQNAFSPLHVRFEVAP